MKGGKKGWQGEARLAGREVRYRCDGEAWEEGERGFRDGGCHWPHQSESSSVTPINNLVSKIQ